jgi:hypothetical protein
VKDLVQLVDIAMQIIDSQYQFVDLMHAQIAHDEVGMNVLPSFENRLATQELGENAADRPDINSCCLWVSWSISIRQRFSSYNQ